MLGLDTKNIKGIKGGVMETLVKIVKIVGPVKGYELHYRTEKGIRVEFHRNREG